MIRRRMAAALLALLVSCAGVLGASVVTASADAGSNLSVLATVSLQKNPLDIAVSPEGSWIYTTDGSDNSVSVLDAVTNAVVATIPVGSVAYGLALSPDGRFAYAVNRDDGTVSVINTYTNTVTNTVSVGYLPTFVAVSPGGSLVYVANSGSSSVSVIAYDRFVVATIPVGSLPSGVAVDPDGEYVYVANAGGGSVTVINMGTNQVEATIPVGSYPSGVAVSPDGTSVYVTNADSNSVSVIDTETNMVTATIPVGSEPYGVAVSPNGQLVYVTNAGSNSVSVIDTATNTVTNTVTVGDRPWGVVVYGDSSRAYVANSWGASLSVLGQPSVTTPAAPTDLSATPGDGSASISFTAGSDGGAAITKYQYSLDEGLSWNDADGTTSPLTISGLTNYTGYGIKLRAVNSAGAGEASSSVSTMPAHAAPVQSAPTVGSARRSILASWALIPANQQFDRIKLYRVKVFLAGTNTKVRTCKGGPTETSCELKGLSIGTAYDVRIEAVHLAGKGPSKTVRRSLMSASRSITLN